MRSFFCALGLLLFPACSAVQPEPKESFVNLPKPRLLPPPMAVKRSEPQVLAHDILENHRRSVEAQRVGPQTLSLWMSSSKLKVLDVTPLRISKTYEPLPKAIKTSPSLVKNTLDGFRGAVILVGHRDGADDLRKAWSSLKELPGLDVMILDGGIEAWSAFVEKGL